MLFTCETAHIVVIGQYSTDQSLGGMNGLTILSAAGGSRISPRKEGSAAGRTHGALTIRPCECDSLIYQGVNGGCMDQLIPERLDGVKSLLIGAVPENIRPIFRGHVLLPSFV